MGNLSINGFKSFCVSKGTASIDNTSWNTCALGLYLASEGFTLVNEYEAPPWQLMCKPSDISAVRDFCQELDLVDADGWNTVYDNLNLSNYDTYKQIAEDL